MSRIRAQRQMFVLGDFVFAKVQGYRHWPARVLGRYGTVSKLKYSVFFYGTCDTAMVPSSHVLDFEKNKRHLGGRHEKHTVRNSDFRSAMADILRAVERPENDFVYYQVLAQTKDEGETWVPYEMLPPASRIRAQRQMFVLGDFVFAKVHGLRHWPARVLGRYGTVSKLKYSVFFYGTCDTAMVPSSHVLDFEKNKRHLGGRHEKHTVRNSDFRSAMADILRAVERPENDFVYYQVLAQTKDEGETWVPYEMLPPATESESETSSEEEDSEEQDSEDSEEDDTTESSSEEDTTESETSLEEEQVPPPAKKPKKSMSEISLDTDTTEAESSSEEDTTESETSLDEEQMPPPANKAKKSMSLLDNQDDAPDQAQVANVLEKELGQDNPVVGNLDEHLKNLEDRGSKLEGNTDGEDKHSEKDKHINIRCRHNSLKISNKLNWLIRIRSFSI